MSDVRISDPLACEAVVQVVDGMTVGLGTGRAAVRGIYALAAKVKNDSLTISCVATSKRSADLAETLGLTVLPMSSVGKIDLLFDGVDELDPDLAMTKGGGGAMTWEKIVAESAAMRIYLMQKSKIVDTLGQNFALPIEVLEFAQAAVLTRLKLLGFIPHLRINEDDSTRYIRTDEGNLIFDCAGYSDVIKSMGAITLDETLNAIPGIVGHGLFTHQADLVLIESDDASQIIERRSR